MNLVIACSCKIHKMPYYGPYNQKMAITSFILTAECERLGPSYSV